MNDCIIGIHDGHDCSIALLIDGEIVAALQEERFTNRKNEVGFPYNAAMWLKERYGLKDISRIILGSGYVEPNYTKLKRETNFTVADWLKEQHLFWKKKLLENEKADYYPIFSEDPNFIFDEYYNYKNIDFRHHDTEEGRRFGENRREYVSKFFSTDMTKVKVIDHERSHQYYALYSSPFRNEKVVVVTSEGKGSYSNATVSVYEGREIEEIAVMEENFLGNIYRYTTLILGMKPAEHEYKVMGLAPYAKREDVEEVLPIFHDLLEVDGIRVKFKNRPKDLYFTIRDRLEGKRFDHIAGALQKFTEEILKEWFANIAGHTGIKKFVFSGGVAQNIKADKAITEIDGIEDLFIAPAAGDTSLSIGAAYLGYLDVQKDKKVSNILQPQPLKTAYLGNEFTAADSVKAIRAYRLNERYRIIANPGSSYIAELLKDGYIIARFSGRMEFGLRALGNRSILADPRDCSTVKRVNEKIKNRDFWMPFAPTILDRYASRYLVNPKDIKSPFMTMAFDTTGEARKRLAAAIHPADLTVRPQILKRETNPAYYELIESFADLTGVGALLNTSFNLHGYPIVGTMERAIETFEKSELDGMLLNSILILRK